jgi:hypothetical protein
MSEKQGNLFSGAGASSERSKLFDARAPRNLAESLDDESLLAAIMEAGLSDGPSLIAEVERRKLPTAIPALEKLCSRFAGFGADLIIPEQVAALRALGAIGGLEAARSVTRLIDKAFVQGPTLNVAVNVAASLGSDLPSSIVNQLLAHADHDVRADACRCARQTPDTMEILIDLLVDLDKRVNVAAACALGRMGNRNALPTLSQNLREAPSAEVIEAVSGVADEDCIILLGRILQTNATLSGAARDALDTIDHPRAAQIIGNMGL